MSKLSADDQILDWIRKKGKLIVEDNSEFYVIIEFTNNKFVYRFGDAGSAKASELKEMHEIEMLEYLRAYFVRKAQLSHQKKLRSSEEVLDYIKHNF